MTVKLIADAPCFGSRYLLPTIVFGAHRIGLCRFGWTYLLWYRWRLGCSWSNASKLINAGHYTGVEPPPSQVHSEPKS